MIDIIIAIISVFGVSMTIAAIVGGITGYLDGHNLW